MPENTNEDTKDNRSAISDGQGRQVEETASPGTRRRSGRRVVRVAGAAGADVPVKVEAEKRKTSRKAKEEEDESKPSATRRRRTRKSKENQAADQSAQDHSSQDAQGDESESKPTRTTTRRRSRTTARRRTEEHAQEGEPDQDRQERALEAVEALTSGLSQRTDRKAEEQDERPRAARTARPRPMTSLLFQEPVIPVSRPEQNERDERDEEDEDAEQSSKPSRRSKSRSTSEGGSRRSRRLNAEERRAADEVERIEEDLDHEGITFVVDEDQDQDQDEDQNESGTRTRRRRRAKSDDEGSEKPVSTRRRRGHEQEKDKDDEDEAPLTRRRRRRRGSKSAEGESEESSTRRSRKQQYIDEITDVEGSTRLEAKKQRRRDNRRERSRQSQLVEQDFLARRENVNRLMVVREKEHHTQISVIEDDILVEHYVSDIQEVSTVGNIYLGRVQNVLPSMEAAFVDIGQARNGVLYAGEVNWDSTRLEGQPRRIELAFKSGDPVLVQVTKDPIGHKGARLTSQVTLAGRFLVLVPSGGMTGVSRKLPDRERSRLKSIVSKVAPKDMGVIIRTAAEGASEEALTKDLENLQRQWGKIEDKRKEFLHGKRPKLLQGEPDVAIRVVRDIFNDDFAKLVVQGEGVYERVRNYLETMAPDLEEKLEHWDPAEHQGKDVFDRWSIDSQLRKGMERQVYLPSGGSLVIDRTEAMTTIDVNTGRFIGKGKSLEETVTRCNLEASEEIARQLRLRDIGGMIMIDYVDMVMPANRDLVLRRLVECLARDRTKHQVAEVTSLGLVQMTRKRVGQGLVEAFSEECPTCHGRGFILHDKPTISASYADPYAVKGGDPFVKTNKHGHGSSSKETLSTGSTPAVKAKLARIAAAAQAASDEDDAQAETADVAKES
ncbi:Rne/Rng family ribonuclease [Bifidobacterium polysaccharolyticum]|uniref:Rne/Rng family ribonuclease n=1 Tax=Bifidobacterium TaxID=1678 RepID=UPI0018DB6B0A|nr:Rne/Rng family ribonuclease [Bifidobacterium polysaccharolyticum]MBI0152629.1 Rne/Rng family ribonuclease [Bifidobacterium sp. M0399]